MVKHGNFTLLLTSSGQEWQFPSANEHIDGQALQLHIATDQTSGQRWQPHFG